MTQFKYVCGECFHWVKKETGTGPVTIGAPARGVCYGAPPTPFAIIERGQRHVTAQTDLRPSPAETERGCGAFVPRDAMSEATAPPSNDDKVS